MTMALVENSLKTGDEWFHFDQRKQQLKDYVDVTSKLIWQRQGIFFSATVLSAFYFDPIKSFACYGAVLFTEVVDLILARRVNKWRGQDPSKARQFMMWVMANTALSAAAISLFVAVIALQQGPGGHFTPLFFLFAAALFAAMNNHQLMPALILRLFIYGCTFTFIVFLDIWRVSPPLSSDLWLHVFTVAFVMYFIIDISFAFLKMYRNNLAQLERLSNEHAKTLAAYKVKSEFVSTVSHELRTPLTSIKGSLELLESGALGTVPSTMQPIISIAAKNSRRLANLINDILDLQKMESGEANYSFAPLNVHDLLQDAVDATLGYADTLGIRLEADLPEMRDVYISGDESRLMQVMANIISNAIKFSNENGLVTVSFRLHGDKVRISVRDNGIGIPENARHKVFGQFSQIDSSDQRSVGGTGLGMNISKRIVERLGGVIDYTSELGKGTTFFIEFDELETD